MRMVSILVRLLKPLEQISRKHFYFDSDENVITSVESTFDKYSYDWLKRNEYKTEDEIRASMTHVDGWEITLSPHLFTNYNQVVKSFDSMLNTQFVKYMRDDKTFRVEVDGKFQYFDIDIFLHNSGMLRENYDTLPDTCYEYVEVGVSTFDMEIRSKDDSLSLIYGINCDYDGHFDKEWDLNSFTKEELISTIHNLVGLIDETLKIVDIGRGRCE